MFWLLIFFLTPIAEMYLLITVAGYINAWPTIGLVMLTAVIGVALLKLQGLATLTRGIGRMNAGEVPAREMAEGILLAVAGALLLTPGFITDFVGFTLLFPPTRMIIAAELLKRVQVHGLQTGAAANFGADAGHFSHSEPDLNARRAGSRQDSDGPVIVDGEFERKP